MDVAAISEQNFKNEEKRKSTGISPSQGGSLSPKSSVPQNSGR